MTRRRVLIFVLLSLALGNVAAVNEETITFPRFGALTIYRSTPHPRNVVLFVSGDGGWNKGVVDMARELSGLDSLVVGIDITRYLRAVEQSSDRCAYPAGDFEALSQFLQKKLDFPAYSVPILVGYSSGATLVYATLVQAPPNTFRGALSLGFCPDLLVTKPFCEGHGLAYGPGPRGKGVSFLPAKHLEAPWIALQGTIDQVCDPPATQKYVSQVPHGEVIMLPQVGHGFGVQKHWLPQFRDAFQRTAATVKREQAPEGGAIHGLPLVEVPAKGTGDLLAVIVSGDGGWAGIDRSLGKTLAAEGVPVIGLNSLQYFWKRRTPDGAAGDLEQILRHYLAAWDKKKVILIGYSRGADVLPFMARRLPPDLLDRAVVIALLGPSTRVDFQFHLTDWISDGSHDSSLPIAPEVEALRGRRVLCFAGNKEKDSLCRVIAPGLTRNYVLPGSHHLGGKYDEIAGIILTETR